MKINKIICLALAAAMGISAASCSDTEKSVVPDIEKISQTGTDKNESPFRKIERFYETRLVTDADMRGTYPLAYTGDRYYFRKDGYNEYDMTVVPEINYFSVPVAGGEIVQDKELKSKLPENSEILTANSEFIVFRKPSDDENEDDSIGLLEINTGRYTEKGISAGREEIFADSRGNVYYMGSYGGRELKIYDKSFNLIKEKNFGSELNSYGDGYIYASCVSPDGKVYFTISDKATFYRIFTFDDNLELLPVTDEIPISENGNDGIVNMMFTDRDGNIAVCSGYGNVNTEVYDSSGTFLYNYVLYGVEGLAGPSGEYDMVYTMSGEVYGYSYLDDRRTAIVSEEDIVNLSETLRGVTLCGDRVIVESAEDTPDRIVAVDHEGNIKEYDADNICEVAAGSDGKLYYMACRPEIGADDEYGTFETVESSVFRLEDDGSSSLLFKLPQYRHEIYPSHFSVDSDGNFVCVYPENEESALYIDKSVLTFNSEGNIVKSVRIPENMNLTGKYTDETGNPVFLALGDSYTENSVYYEDIYAVDYRTGEQKILAEKSEIRLQDVMDGSEGYDFYYSDAGKIYGYRVSDNTSDEIMSSSDCDEELYDGSRFIVISPQEILLGEGKKLVRMDDEKLDKLNSRKILTLAAGDPYFLESFVKEFNKNSEDFRIYLKSYPYTGDDYRVPDLSEDFKQDLAGGNIPDIVSADDLYNVSDLITKGVFADHRKLIEETEGIELSEYGSRLADVFSYRGSMYVLPLSWYIRALKVSEEPEKNDFTSLYNLTEKNETCFGGMRMALGLMESCVYDCSDPENRTCGFENDNFKDCLKIYARSQNEYEEGLKSDIFDVYENYAAKEMSADSLRDMSREMMYSEGYESELKISAFPSADGKGKTMICPQYCFSVTEASENKAEAMEVIKAAADYFQKYYYFDSFDFVKTNGSETDKPVYGYDEDCPEEVRSELNKLLDKPLFSDMAYTDIKRIVYDEAERFVSGELTAEETAASVQKKVSLYLSETE